jgi:hypothetical protein
MQAARYTVYRYSRRVPPRLQVFIISKLVPTERILKLSTLQPDRRKKPSLNDIFLTAAAVNLLLSNLCSIIHILFQELRIFHS